MQGYYVDSQSDVVTECYAVVHAPKRRRDRHAENCVQVVASAEEALLMADATQNRFAAKVLGPARSSEGCRVYYLVAWLSP